METDISGLFYCPRQQQAHGNNRVLKGELVRLGEGSCRSLPFTISTTKGPEGPPHRGALRLVASTRPGGRWSPPAGALALSRSLRNACGRSGEAVSAGRQPHRSWPEPHGAAGRCFADHPAPLAGSFWRPQWGHRPPRGKGAHSVRVARTKVCGA